MRTAAMVFLLVILVLSGFGCSSYQTSSGHGSNLIFDSPKIRHANEVNPAPRYENPNWPSYQQSREEVNAYNEGSYERYLYSRQSVSSSGRPRNFMRYTERYEQSSDDHDYQPHYNYRDFQQRNF